MEFIIKIFKTIYFIFYTNINSLLINRKQKKNDKLKLKFF